MPAADGAAGLSRVPARAVPAQTAEVAPAAPAVPAQGAGDTQHRPEGSPAHSAGKQEGRGHSCTR